MRKRLAAVVFASSVLLSMSVTPALAYTSSGWLQNSHCPVSWTISSAYRGVNKGTVKWTHTSADPYTQCYAISAEMKYVYTTSDFNTKTASSGSVRIYDPYNQNYTATVRVDGVYCLAIRFWASTAPGFGNTTGWLTC
jgi:hypothetical protein